MCLVATDIPCFSFSTYKNIFFLVFGHFYFVLGLAKLIHIEIGPCNMKNI
jgi:hypothetical protein